MSFMTGLCSALCGHLSIFLEVQLILLITAQSTLQFHLLFCPLLQSITAQILLFQLAVVVNFSSTNIKIKRFLS